MILTSAEDINDGEIIDISLIEKIPNSPRGSQTPHKVDGQDLVNSFDVRINKESWEVIRPVEVYYESNNQSCWKLGSEYINVYFRAIWDTSKIPCCWCIRRHVVKKNDDKKPFIKITAYCNVCSAQLEGIVEREEFEEDGSIIIKTTMTNRKCTRHVKSQRLYGRRREGLKGQLVYQTATYVDGKIVDEAMEIGDPYPPFRHSKDVLRKAKEDAISEKFQIQKGASIWTSLDELSRNPKIKPYIQDIGYNRTHITYWSPDQIKLHNLIQQKAGTSISIDATSSVAKKILREGKESSALFLYNIVCHIRSLIVPLGQMISEKQDANFITYWLQSWMGAGAATPRCVVTDRSKALENAVSMTFNLCPFLIYNEKCLKLLMSGAKRVKNLKCWIRNDIAHLIKSITQWKCWKKTHEGRKTKKFYMMLIGFLTTIKNFEDFIEVTKRIMRVAHAESDTPNIRKDKEELIRCIESHKFEEIRDFVEEQLATAESEKITPALEDEEAARASAPEKIPAINDIVDESFAQPNESKSASETKKKEKPSDLMSMFIDHLRPESEIQGPSTSKSAIKNEYFSPQFLVKFCKLLRYFPTWSNLMQELFEHDEDVATSARSEAYFADVKKELRTYSTRPLRMDKFFSFHCNSIGKSMKKAYASLHEISSTLKRPTFAPENRDHITTFENWRNKAEKPDPVIDLISEEYSPAPSLINNSIIDLTLHKDENPLRSVSYHLAKDSGNYF